MQTSEIIQKIQNDELNDKFLDIYQDSTKIDYQKERYIVAIKKFESFYGALWANGSNGLFGWESCLY